MPGSSTSGGGGLPPSASLGRSWLALFAAFSRAAADEPWHPLPDGLPGWVFSSPPWTLGCFISSIIPLVLIQTFPQSFLRWVDKSASASHMLSTTLGLLVRRRPSMSLALGSGTSGGHLLSPAVVDATFIRSSASPGIAACTVAVALPVSVWARHPILARTHHPHKVPWKSMRVNRPWLASSALSLAAPTPTEPALKGGQTMSACGTTSMPI